jgi:hypothetical protein
MQFPPSNSLPMTARDIPHPQWPSFLGRFGLRHFGWTVTLEQKFHGRGKLILTNQSFLEEVSADGDNGRQRITIVLGSPFHGFRTHVVSDPQRLRVADREGPALRIDSDDGSTTVIRLRQPYRVA